MYAIVQIGSGQYKVSKGDTITVERIDHEAGKAVSFDRVILFSDGKKEVIVGAPYIKGMKINTQVLRHFDGKKKISFKFNRRKHYFKKHGHRQLLTLLKVEDISEKSGKD